METQSSKFKSQIKAQIKTQVLSVFISVAAGFGGAFLWSHFNPVLGYERCHFGQPYPCGYLNEWVCEANAPCGDCDAVDWSHCAWGDGGGGGGDGYCGSDCTRCVLDNRPDILPFYAANGWDTSCGNRDNIVNNWCGIDPSGCDSVKRNQCGTECGYGCGNWGPTIGDPSCTQQNGLKGRYHRGTSFNQGLKMVRYDSTVNFNWGGGSPDSNRLECDLFSVTWSGWVRIPRDGRWTFYTWTDDGVRLYVNSRLIINRWRDQGPTEWQGQINLNSGWYPIIMQYYENRGGAVARLSYSGPGAAKQVIPSSEMRSCNPPPGPKLSCSFISISSSSGAIVGSGTSTNPHKIQRGTESITIAAGGNPDPGGGTANFSVVFPGGGESTISNNVPYSSDGWREVWDDSDPTRPVNLPENNGYRVKVKFNGYGNYAQSDGFCYFDVVPPANAEYVITARGAVTSGTRSFCFGQDAGCVIPYYPEGRFSGLNTPFNTDPYTYDSLFSRFGQSAQRFSSSLPTSTGTWYTEEGLTINNQFSFPANRKILIFIDGDLTINGRISVPASSVVGFVVSGEIRFRRNLSGGDIADGLYIAQGDINTAYNYSGTEVTPRLIVNGALISTKGTVVLLRSLSDSDNVKYPAEQIRMDPKYYVLFADYLGDSKVSWREVGEK